MTRKEKLYREEYVTTIKRLLDYAVEHYPELTYSRLLDTERGYTFTAFGQACKAIVDKYDELGIGAGEKIVLLAQNMPEWAVAFVATASSGRVIVPVLAESSAQEVSNIVEHSEAVGLFVSEAKKAQISPEVMDKMKFVYDLDTLQLVKETPGEPLTQPVAEPQPDDLAGLFYTSGTTGKAKGVMLSHRNLCQNVIAASYAQPAEEGQRWLSILPAAHTYELAFSLLYPLFVGGEVSYLQKAPTPSVLGRALQEVKPHIVCSVPLIIEKIYRSSVRKTIDKSRTLIWMEHVFPHLTYRIIGGKLKKFFGGNLGFFGVGGAKLDPVVESFLIKAHFPYAIGYGLTETAPLITAKVVGSGRCGTIGPHCHNVEVRLGNVDPSTGEGEIQCKGPNVMLGYYKDPERTAGVFTKDGWFRTGDLASCSADGFYTIRGRLGSMIVGPSGENIYPEEIESVINNFSGVGESLVVYKEGKLVAMVKFDESVIDFDTQRTDQWMENIEEKKKALMEFVNAQVRKSNNINEVEIMEHPFVKTATMKIRRFLYQKKQ
ncbi:MAG: AMP-binding protein [Bacteroidales bacterium]|nr:AMP-binding protein [Candidatus Cryptobacteroides equifaecalis]